MGNYSSAYEEILPCDKETVLCYQPFNEIYVGINCVSILLNILHLLILNDMKELKTTKYFWVLTNISVTDITTNIILIVYLNCDIRQLILQLPVTAAYWTFKAIGNLTGYASLLRFMVFLVASVEKYVGVCRPYSYSTHVLIVNLKSFTVFLYVLAFLLKAVGSLVIAHPLCQASLKVQVAGKTLTGSLVGSLYVMTVLTLSILITVLLVKVWRKLREMVSSNAANNKVLMAASKYIILIYVIYQSSLISTVMFVICTILKVSPLITDRVEAVGAVLTSLYSIVNIPLFAFFHPKYLHVVRSHLKLRRFNKVSPMNGGQRA